MNLCNKFLWIIMCIILKDNLTKSDDLKAISYDVRDT